MTIVRGVCAALVLAAAVGWAAGCGTAQTGEVGEAALDCKFTSTSCECDSNYIDDSDPKECSAASMKGTCCENGSDYSPDCTCHRLGCAVVGSACWCGVQATSMTSCSPPSGVCCLAPADRECRCYYTSNSCPAGEQPVANCTTGQLTCDALGGGTQRSSCSRVKVVEVGADEASY
jgi:hypothetical protein